MPIPPLAIAGIAAAGLAGAYLWNEDAKKKAEAEKAKKAGGAAPAASAGVPLGTPVSYQPNQVPVAIPKPTLDDVRPAFTPSVPLGPSGLPRLDAPVPSLGGLPIPGSAAAIAQNMANVAAAAAQLPFPPGQDNQPPLPPPPPQELLPPGKTAIVATNGAPGNDSALRVRSGPSTTAAPVPGGEPGVGGGFEKGQTVTITGLINAGFTPVTGRGRQGGTLTGWVGSGYLK